MQMLEILLTDPIGQLSLFTVGFCIAMSLFLGVYFYKKSSKKK